MTVYVRPHLLRRIRCRLGFHAWVDWSGAQRTCHYCPTYSEVVSGDYWPERVERIEGAREQAVWQVMQDILEQRRARQNRAAFFGRTR